MPPKSQFACDNCRSKKRRCSGQTPCERCVRLGETCTVKRPVFATLTERLEARIAQLQSEIDKISSSASTPRSSPLRQTNTTEPIASSSSIKPYLEILLAHPLFSHELRASVAPFLETIPCFPYPILIQKQLDGLRVDRTQSYIHVVSRAAVLASLSQWNGVGSVPVVLSEYLLRIFGAHRPQFEIFGNLTHHMSVLHAPIDHPDHVHPCIWEALYLSACYVAGFKEWEVVFLARLRTQMEDALAFAKHFAFLRASCMLAKYHRNKGRILAAFSIVSAAAKLAVGVGLHLGPARPSGILTEEEQVRQDKEYVWTKIWMADRSLSQIAGFPTSSPEECLSSLESEYDVDTNAAINSDEETLQWAPLPSARVRFKDKQTFDVSGDDEMWLRVKVMVLLDAAISLSHLSNNTERFHAAYHTLFASLREYERTLPPINDPRTCRLPLEEMQEVTTIILPHFYAKGVALTLLNLVVQAKPLAEDPSQIKLFTKEQRYEAYQQRLNVAKEVGILAKHVKKTGQPLSSVLTEVDMLAPVQMAAVVLLDEMKKVICSPDYLSEDRYHQLGEINPTLLALLDLLTDLLNVFPSWRQSIPSLKEVIVKML